MTKRMASMRQTVFGEEVKEDGSAKVQPSKLNVIQRIMKNVTAPVLIEHARKP